VVDEPVAPGDFVLNHVGFAIRRIPEAEIAATLALYERLLAEAIEGDPMVADVESEIAAGGAASSAGAPRIAPAAPANAEERR
jgi:hydrogenase expression/formation protein HypC